jgi:hypothetical protein
VDAVSRRVGELVWTPPEVLVSRWGTRRGDSSGRLALWVCYPLGADETVGLAALGVWLTLSTARRYP